MPEAKKVAKPKKSSKPKAIKAKPVSTVKNSTTRKPKAKIVKPAPKVEAKKPEFIVPVEVKKAKKTRSYTRKPKGTFADLLKKQAELEEIKKGAKAELKKQFDDLIKESEKVKTQYQELFHEVLLASVKIKSAGTRAKKVTGKIPGLKPFTLKEIEDFIDQKKEGVVIRIHGRRPKSIARIEDAFMHSEDAQEILRILNN
jgi:hypothetical protein